MSIGDARVFTDDQNLDLQRMFYKRSGATISIPQQSGPSTERLGLSGIPDIA